MRLLGVLALAAPVAVGLLFLTDPGLTASWVDDATASMVAAARPLHRSGVGLTAAWPGSSSASGSGAWSRRPSGSRPATTRSTVSEPRRRPRGAPRPRPSTASRPPWPTRTTARPIDRLTGVANRQALLAALFAEVERASRYERPLCVAFVDIDHFKAVNDTYGHAAGDVVLRGVAQTIAENLRASDLIGRYGGEEFMLILTETNVEDGAALSEKLRKLVERCRFTVEGNPDLSVTISIGIVGGSGPAAPDGEPRARCGRGDVLGQVARPQPDLHLRGARRGRARPARPDLRRRAGPGDGDRPRRRATPRRTC